MTDKERIEEIARKYLKTLKNGHLMTEIDLLYYLSGYFKEEKIFLADVLEVVAKLKDENLIRMSF